MVLPFKMGDHVFRDVIFRLKAYRHIIHLENLLQIRPFFFLAVSPNNTQLIWVQICRALAYIHNCIGICHRDIKPQNLLVRLFFLKNLLFVAQDSFWIRLHRFA